MLLFPGCFHSHFCHSGLNLRLKVIDLEKLKSAYFTAKTVPAEFSFHLMVNGRKLVLEKRRAIKELLPLHRQNRTTRRLTNQGTLYPICETSYKNYVCPN